MAPLAAVVTAAFAAASLFGAQALASGAASQAAGSPALVIAAQPITVPGATAVLITLAADGLPLLVPGMAVGSPLLAVDVDLVASPRAADEAAIAAVRAALYPPSVHPAQRLALLTVLPASIPIGSFSAAAATRPNATVVADACAAAAAALPTLPILPCAGARQDVRASAHWDTLDVAAAAIAAPHILGRDGRLAGDAFADNATRHYSPLSTPQQLVESWPASRGGLRWAPGVDLVASLCSNTTAGDDCDSRLLLASAAVDFPACDNRAAAAAGAARDSPWRGIASSGATNTGIGTQLLQLAGAASPLLPRVTEAFGRAATVAWLATHASVDPHRSTASLMESYLVTYPAPADGSVASTASLAAALREAAPAAHEAAGAPHAAAVTTADGEQLGPFTAALLRAVAAGSPTNIVAAAAPFGVAAGARAAALLTSPAPARASIATSTLTRSVLGTGLHRDLFYGVRVRVPLPAAIANVYGHGRDRLASGRRTPADPARNAFVAPSTGAPRKPLPWSDDEPRCHIALVQRIEAATYFDLDEVRDSERQGGAVLRAFAKFIDVERPTSASSQHHIVMALPLDDLLVGGAGRSFAREHAHGGANITLVPPSWSDSAAHLDITATFKGIFHARYQAAGCGAPEFGDGNGDGAAIGGGGGTCTRWHDAIAPLLRVANAGSDAAVAYSRVGADGSFAVRAAPRDPGAAKPWWRAGNASITGWPWMTGCYSLAHLPLPTVHIGCTTPGPAVPLRAGGKPSSTALRALFDTLEAGDDCAATNASHCFTTWTAAPVVQWPWRPADAFASAPPPPAVDGASPTESTRASVALERAALNAAYQFGVAVLVPVPVGRVSDVRMVVAVTTVTSVLGVIAIIAVGLRQRFSDGKGDGPALQPPADEPAPPSEANGTAVAGLAAAGDSGVRKRVGRGASVPVVR